MGKELERLGLPVIHICTMVNVALSVGSNRVLPGESVLHPTGFPESDPQDERMLRRRLLERALEALRQRIEKPSVLEAG